MKVLIDESIDVDFRHELAGHDAYTVTYMGWNGLKNGELLPRRAVGFDALITTDKNMEYQQNNATLPCTVIVMHVRSNDLIDLQPLVTNLLRALSNPQPHAFIRVTP